MSTIRARASVEVDRPADQVWELVADYARDPEWRTGVVTMAPSTPGTVQPGTTTAEELRVAGRAQHNGGLVTAVQPGTRFAWRTTSGVAAAGARAVIPVRPGRCRVDLELDVTLSGLQRLARPLLAVVVRRTLAADARRLAALAERTPARPGPADPPGGPQRQRYSSSGRPVPPYRGARSTSPASARYSR